jgi:hypothetical protein
MKRLLVSLLVGLCLTPVLAGCGGSSKPAAAPATTATTTASPTTASPTAASSLTARADAICRAYHRRLAQLGAPQTMQDIADYYGFVQTALGRMVDRLAALRPRTAAVDAFVAATRAELKPAADLRAAALAGSGTRIREIAIRGALLDKKAHALAERAKLRACAETPASG